MQDSPIAPVPSPDDSAKALAAFEEHRQRLFAIAYRMLGSASDAEDILQEAYLRWQQSSRAEVHSPAAFLVTIVSRICINHLQSARHQREEYFGPWLPEPVLTGPTADPYLVSEMDESLSVAFLVMLERLTPTERAVFLLREVFEYDYDAIAGILETSVANCRQLLRRARLRVKEGRPRFAATARQQEEMVRRFLTATSSGTLDDLLGLISEDIVLYADGGGKATAVPNPIFGAGNVARFLLGARKKLLPADPVRQIAEINGRPGVVMYRDGQPFGVLTLEVEAGRICNIYIVSNPDKLSRLPRLSAAPC